MPSRIMVGSRSFVEDHTLLCAPNVGRTVMHGGGMVGVWGWYACALAGLYQVCRLLRSDHPVPLRVERAPEASDHDLVQQQQARLEVNANEEGRKIGRKNDGFGLMLIVACQCTRAA